MELRATGSEWNSNVGFRRCVPSQAFLGSVVWPTANNLRARDEEPVQEYVVDFKKPNKTRISQVKHSWLSKE